MYLKPEPQGRGAAQHGIEPVNLTYVYTPHIAYIR